MSTLEKAVLTASAAQLREVVTQLEHCANVGEYRGLNEAVDSALSACCHVRQVTILAEDREGGGPFASVDLRKR